MSNPFYSGPVFSLSDAINAANYMNQVDAQSERRRSALVEEEQRDRQLASVLQPLRQALYERGDLRAGNEIARMSGGHLAELDAASFQPYNDRLEASARLPMAVLNPMVKGLYPKTPDGPGTYPQMRGGSAAPSGGEPALDDPFFTRVKNKKPAAKMLTEQELFEARSAALGERAIAASRLPPASRALALEEIALAQQEAASRRNAISGVLAEDFSATAGSPDSKRTWTTISEPVRSRYFPEAVLGAGPPTMASDAVLYMQALGAEKGSRQLADMFESVGRNETTRYAARLGQSQKDQVLPLLVRLHDQHGDNAKALGVQAADIRARGAAKEAAIKKGDVAVIAGMLGISDVTKVPKYDQATLDKMADSFRKDNDAIAVEVEARRDEEERKREHYGSLFAGRAKLPPPPKRIDQKYIDGAIYGVTVGKVPVQVQRGKMVANFGEEGGRAFDAALEAYNKKNKK
jgi:hypothetical protein